MAGGRSASTTRSPPATTPPTILCTPSQSSCGNSLPSVSFAVPLLAGLEHQQQKAIRLQQQRSVDVEVETAATTLPSLTTKYSCPIGTLVHDALRYEEAIRLIERFFLLVVVPKLQQRSKCSMHTIADVNNDNSNSSTMSREIVEESPRNPEVAMTAKLNDNNNNNSTSAAISKRKSLSENETVIDISCTALTAGSFLSLTSTKKRKVEFSIGFGANNTTDTIGSSLTGITSTKTLSLFTNYAEHWLWRLIRSYPIDERISATLMLLTAAKLNDAQRIDIQSRLVSTIPATCSKVSMRRRQLRGASTTLHNRIADHIIHLFNKHILSLLSLNSSQPQQKKLFQLRNPIIPNEGVFMVDCCPPSRLAIEWAALLEHLWTDTNNAPAQLHKAGSDSLKPQEQDQHEELLLDANRILKIFMIEKKKQDWIWLTQSIWICARDCAAQIIHHRHNQSNVIATSAVTSLVALSRLAYILSIHRTVRVPKQIAHTRTSLWTAASIPGSSSGTSVNDNIEDVQAKANSTKSIQSSTKKTGGTHRTRSDSNSSIRSNNTTEMQVENSDRKITTTSTESKATDGDATESPVSQHQLQEKLVQQDLRMYNTDFLWKYHNDCDDGETLSPLACLIGAYFIANEYSSTDPGTANTASSSCSSTRISSRLRNPSDSPPIQCWFASIEEDQSHDLNRSRGRHNYELSSTVSGGAENGSSMIVDGFVQGGGTNCGNPTTIAGALQRASQILEQLVCPLTECKVSVVQVDPSERKKQENEEQQKISTAKKDKRNKRKNDRKSKRNGDKSSPTNPTIRSKSATGDEKRKLADVAAIAGRRNKQKKSKHRLKMSTEGSRSPNENDDEDYYEGSDDDDDDDNDFIDVDFGVIDPYDDDIIAAAVEDEAGNVNDGNVDITLETVDNEDEDQDAEVGDEDDEDDDDEEKKERQAKSNPLRDSIRDASTSADEPTKDESKTLGDMFLEQICHSEDDNENHDDEVDNDDEVGYGDTEDEDEDNQVDRDKDNDDIDNEEGSRIPDDDDDEGADSFEGSNDGTDHDRINAEECAEDEDEAVEFEANAIDNDETEAQVASDTNGDVADMDIDGDNEDGEVGDEKKIGVNRKNGDGERDDEEDDDGDDDDDDDEDDDIDAVMHDERMVLLDEVCQDEVELARRTNTRTIRQQLSSSAPVSLTVRRVSDPEANKVDPIVISPNLEQRKLLYIKACMQVMMEQYPPSSSQQHQLPIGQIKSSATYGSIMIQRKPFLSHVAEDALLGSINTAVKPPKKPLNTKIIMRRAPTQEEFFRGSLSRNPISLSSLSSNRRGHGGGTGGSSTEANSNEDQQEPTVADLRQHIANDLQMADSAELIEIIVANKIVDIKLKLRVVHQVLWKNHLIETSTSSSSSLSAAANALFTSASGGGATSYFAAAGSAISMIFSSTSSSDRNGGSGRVTKDTSASALPPMVVTYRLAGVDGEATEDTVHIGDLSDPDAPSETSSPEEVEKLLENEYGITRLVTEGRGIYVLLRSVQHHVNETLRRIRRDDVGCGNVSTSPSRIAFRQSRPCNGLILLRYCSRLPSNRKKILQARAPTVLLTLLLDVLRTLEDSTSTTTVSTTTMEDVSKSNPTADILQQLIEVLTSDISSSAAEAENNNNHHSDQDVASMHLLLESIETISLSLPLRSVVAKLLPFLTYGQPDLSRELAHHFCTHIVAENLSDFESSNRSDVNESVTNTNPNKSTNVLMTTFVQTALNLPTNSVCDILRSELLTCGFHQRFIKFILRDMPNQPPPWTVALNSKGHEVKKEFEGNENPLFVAGKQDVCMRDQPETEQPTLQNAWRIYYNRDGLKMAFKILTSLCLKHPPTQSSLARFPGLLHACHWIETTSDSNSAGIETKGIGLLAETLIDEMSYENDEVASLTDSVRKQTRIRKKELADIRRSNALRKMTSFGLLSKVSSSSHGLTLSTQATGLSSIAALNVDSSKAGEAETMSSYDSVALLASNQSCSVKSSSKGKTELDETSNAEEKPAWLMEAEMIEDESGLICAVCQEGRTLQPLELLGLYAYVKKVSIPIELCGSRSSVDGTSLFRALPPTLPETLTDSQVVEEWFMIAREVLEQASFNSSSSLTLSSSGGRRNSIFTTTVSAGNGIHITCHRMARQADRTHPKAPKSEWEGASLRNNRCNCNVILPLVSSRSSKVPLIAVDTALTDHQAAVSNLLGSNPKSMLWTVLHDVRLLILRMAYGEALNSDCGGGSLYSNCQLIFYQLLMADMFDQDAQVDQPQMSQHARGLSAALLVGCAILTTNDTTSTTPSSLTSLTRAIADAAPMAALTCILFHNCKPNDGKMDPPDVSSEVLVPHPKRQWLVGNDLFLQSLLVCAGRRHALGIDGSGCLNNSRSGNRRPSVFADWDILNVNNDNEGDEDDDEYEIIVGVQDEDVDSKDMSSRKRKIRSIANSGKPSIDDFQNVLRPMLTYYAIMNQLSAEFTISADDVQIAESAQRLEDIIQKCQRSRNIHELLRNVKFHNNPIKPDEMIDLLQMGMVAAY